jgi:hypothetical protein
MQYKVKLIYKYLFNHLKIKSKKKFGSFVIYVFGNSPDIFKNQRQRAKPNCVALISL